MHYYEHNVGDYRKDTAHLSLLEHGVYRQLLDTYYLDEHPLTLDHTKLMRSHSVRNADEIRALENVLADFFERTEKGYVHKRCESVIGAYKAKSASAKKSAEARWAKERGNDDAGAMRSHSDGNANHKPSTINQEPKEKTKAPRAKRAPRPSKTSLPSDFSVSDRVRSWAAENGHARLDEHFDSFVRKARAKGYEYASWDDAFMEAIRGDWAGLKRQQGPPRAQSWSEKNDEVIAQLTGRSRGYEPDDRTIDI
jgi:uncharacterized protein YdaU (DUF1376 family)